MGKFERSLRCHSGPLRDWHVSQEMSDAYVPGEVLVGLTGTKLG